MAYKFYYNDREDIIEIVLTGIVTEAETKENTPMSIDLAQTHNCGNYIIDAIEMEAGLTITDTYFRPKLYIEKQLSFQSCAALILPRSPKARDTMKFWETICINNGWRVKSFETRDEAVTWINSTIPSKGKIKADEKLSCG